MKPSLFIGSSSEGLDVAREAEFHLQDVADDGLLSGREVRLIVGEYSKNLPGGEEADVRRLSSLSAYCKGSITPIE